MPDRFPTPSPLPIMPHTARQVRTLLQDPRSTNDRIEAVLLNDPAATLALYRILDRLRPGAGDEASGPAHVLSMIGRDALREAFGQLPILDDGRRIGHLLSPAFAYGQAAHAGWYAHRIASLLGFEQATAMQVAALLQHPAILALWQQDFDAAARASNAIRDGVPIENAFTAELGKPLAHADRQLAAAWRLPRLTLEAAGDRDPVNRQPQSISLAVRMAETAYAAWPAGEVDLLVALISRLVPRHLHDAGSWWRRETVEAARHLAPWGYPLPARELPLIPGGEEPVEIPPLPKRPRPQTAKGGLQALLGTALKELARESGTRRVLFCMLSPDREQLRTRLALGLPSDSPLRSLCLSMQDKHLFKLLLTRPQAAHVTPQNRERYAPYLASIPLDEQAQEGFYATSVFVNRKPVGILYADGGAPSATGYTAFRRTAARITRLLETREPKAA